MQDLDRTDDALQVVPLKSKDNWLVDAEDEAVEELAGSTAAMAFERTC